MSRHVARVETDPAAVMADLRIQALRLPNAYQQRDGNSAALVCARSLTPVRFGQLTRVHVLVTFETDDGDAEPGGPQQFWHVSTSVCPDSAGGRQVQVPERELRAWVAAGWPGAEDLGFLAAKGAATHMELQVDELGAPQRRRLAS